MVDRNALIEKIKSYDQHADIDMIEEAIDMAIEYHSHQTRASGEPYYYHPLEVANIIADLKLDSASIITALLHDTVEDTDLTLEDLRRHFGDKVAMLVDGVTKLNKIEFQPDNLRQAENFRKLLLAMSDDIRVLLVKLADRLHNMRTIEHIKSPEKRIRIALETTEIYGPLAERIGAQKLKLELQDISFKVLQPEVRDSIINRLNQIVAHGQSTVEEVVAGLCQVVKNAGVEYIDIHGRQKTPYSIWMKMSQKNVSFDQLSDIIAFRIIVDNIPDCYKVLGVVHTNYKVVPENFQDFISTPKSNGYRSLHTVVIGPGQNKIEVQIRTQEMHEVAELGVAAHWMYKQKYQDNDGKRYSWIRELLSILEHTSDVEEFLQNTKLAMHYNQVFCFSPKGELIALPKKSTPIDFAYAVHSDVGNHCVGAKVNGRIVPLSAVLDNGDQVEIITANNQTPSPSWEKFVVTGKARSEIRKFINSQQKQQYVDLGKIILEKSLVAEFEGQDLQELLNKALKNLSKKTLEELYYSVGEGILSRKEVIKAIKNEKKTFTKSPLSLLKFKKVPKVEDKLLDVRIPIKGLISGMAVHYASCCHPLPGDKIVGIVHSGKGISVHTSDCEMMESFTSDLDNIINLSWDSEASNVPFVTRLKAILLNETGSLALLTTEVAKLRANITNFRITKRNTDFFELLIDIEVSGANHLNNIIFTLNSHSQIHSVERFKA